MEWWQAAIAVLVGLTILVTFVVAGIGNFRQAGNKAAIEALEATNRTQEKSITTLRDELADMRLSASEREAEHAKGEADSAKREAKSKADIATLQTEVKNLLSQRPSIDLLTDMSSRLDEYYDGIIALVSGKK